MCRSSQARRSRRVTSPSSTTMPRRAGGVAPAGTPERKRLLRTLGVLAVAGGWLLAVAGAAGFLHPGKCSSQVRVRRYGKVAMMAAFMSAHRLAQRAACT